MGKTTLAAHLSIELSAKGKGVQLIDCDPQRSLSIWAGMGTGFLASRVQPLTSSNEAHFMEAVEAMTKQFEIVIIDTAAGLFGSSRYVAKVSNVVLVPCGASPLDLTAANNVVALCREIRQASPAGEPFIGLVPSRYLQNSGLGRDLQSALAQLGEPTLPGVSQRVALAEAAISGLTIQEFAPNSVAHREVKELAKALRSILHEDRTQAAKA